MKTLILRSVVLGVLALGASACQSHRQAGVKSDYHSQWTHVNADTSATTEAARTVLQNAGLTDVQAQSTGVDGTASGKEANGKQVKITIKRGDSGGSDVSATVGTLGDPSLGADFVRQIKLQAETGSTSGR